MSRCSRLSTLEIHLNLEANSVNPYAMLSAWDVVLGLLQDGVPRSLQHIKVVCIPDSHNMGLFNFAELERLLTAPTLSLRSLTFEDALVPCQEPEMLERWDEFDFSERSTALRILGLQAFRDTLTAKMPVLAASGVLRVTSQMRYDSE